MTQLTTHFNRAEFACKCGCGFDTVDCELLMLCETVRYLNGNRPITPSSGCRCVEYNKIIGGGENSQHLIGRAADLHVQNPEGVYRKLCNMFPKRFGFGLYPWGVHVDSRENPARWRWRG